MGHEACGPEDIASQITFGDIFSQDMIPFREQCENQAALPIGVQCQSDSPPIGNEFEGFFLRGVSSDVYVRNPGHNKCVSVGHGANMDIRIFDPACSVQFHNTHTLDFYFFASGVTLQWKGASGGHAISPSGCSFLMLPAENTKSCSTPKVKSRLLVGHGWTIELGRNLQPVGPGALGITAAAKSAVASVISVAEPTAKRAAAKQDQLSKNKKRRSEFKKARRAKSKQRIQANFDERTANKDKDAGKGGGKCGGGGACGKVTKGTVRSNSTRPNVALLKYKRARRWRKKQNMMKEHP